MAHPASTRQGPHDPAFHRQGTQPDLEHQVDGGSWRHLDGELDHQSPGADSPYRTMEFSRANLTAPADGRQGDRDSANASLPWQTPPQGFSLPRTSVPPPPFRIPNSACGPSQVL